MQNNVIFVTLCPIWCAKVICQMGRKGALSKVEEFKMTQRLHNELPTLDIAKELGLDHHTIKKFAINPACCNESSEKGKI